MLYTIGWFISFFFITYFTAPYFINLIKNSATGYNITLNIFKVTEPVSIYIKTMLFQSVSVTLPILFIQLYLFIKPTLNKHTRRLVIMTIPFVSVLFLVGAFLGYEFAIPLLFSFFFSASESLGMNTVYSFSDFFLFTFTICVIFGVILELPAILVFLTLINIVTPQMLKKYRKFCYPLLCLFAVVVTPPDFVSDLVVMCMLFILYEISIMLSKLFYSKKMSSTESL